MSDSETTSPDREPFINWFEGNVLADRYLETMLADWKGTGLLLLQAPLLAGLAVMVWQNVGKANSSMYFVMVLSMLWIGCMNGCREVVKERALFLREKMAGQNVASYLYSKVRVLGLLGCVQAITYGIIVYNYVDTRIAVGWILFAMLATVFCGICLGLLLSSIVRRTDYAVALVPLVIIPQILFSEFSIDEDQFEGASEVVFTLMPSRWGYEAMMNYADSGVSQLEATGYLIPLLIFGVVFLLIALPLLKRQKY